MNRGSTKDDYDNFVNFVGSLREAFDAADGGWQVTVSVPYDYANLRGFSLEYLARHVDWFNLHAYDLHDVWEKDANGNGYIRAHANLTAIEATLDLFARNNIDPDKIVLGLGFHGTSYTLEDTSCSKPGCKFGGPGFEGDCTREQGFLSYEEVTDLVPQLGTETFYDEGSASKWMVSSLSQWISYEDAESFGGKLTLLMTRCLRGFAVMSLDLDTQDHQALTALVGEEAMVRGLVEDQLSPDERKHLVDDLAAYTGQKCYVAQGCSDGSGNDPQLAKCGPNEMSIETAHFPLQIDRGFLDECPEGKWHHICCPKAALPSNCEWRGAPEQSEFGCTPGCGEKQYELTRDSFLDPEGRGDCYSGHRSVSSSPSQLML